MVSARIALATACSLYGIACFSQSGEPRALYEANGCYQCHGYEGQGGAAPRISPTAYSFDAFAAFVRRPVNEMPAYSPRVLGDAALQMIYDYVRSRPEPVETLRLSTEEGTRPR
jgi:mono/diheme cytochrome c family protein